MFMFLKICYVSTTAASLVLFGTGVIGVKLHGKLDHIFGPMMNVRFYLFISVKVTVNV